MSLHDVDKSNLDRGTPSTNSSDVINPDNVMSHKTISTHYATDADTSVGRLQMGNKQIAVYDSSSNILTSGILVDGTLGMSATDSSGFVTFKLNGSTWYWYDKATGNNVMQLGLLPDGTYGFAVAKPGKNVSDIYS